MNLLVLQSLLAFRVSDYYQLTYDNIVKYIADKKKDKTVATIRVPLTNRAQELIKRYEDHECKTIMPFISQQKYNDSIKLVLKTVGIDRVVAPTAIEYRICSKYSYDLVGAVKWGCSKSHLLLQVTLCPASQLYCY